MSGLGEGDIGIQRRRQPAKTGERMGQVKWVKQGGVYPDESSQGSSQESLNLRGAMPEPGV